MTTLSQSPAARSRHRVVVVFFVAFVVIAAPLPPGSPLDSRTVRDPPPGPRRDPPASGEVSAATVTATPRKTTNPPPGSDGGWDVRCTGRTAAYPALATVSAQSVEAGILAHRPRHPHGGDRLTVAGQRRPCTGLPLLDARSALTPGAHLHRGYSVGASLTGGAGGVKQLCRSEPVAPTIEGDARDWRCRNPSPAPDRRAADTAAPG